MRTAPNISFKKKRIGHIDNEIKLPEEGEIVTLDPKIFKVYRLKKYREKGNYIGEFVLNTMDGELTINIKITSAKPFRN